MSKYSALAKRSTAMLKRYGILITISNNVSLTNPATGEASSTSSLSFSGYGLKGRYSKTEIRDTILATDLKVVFDGTTLETPHVGFIATFSGKSYRIVDVRTVEPADTAIVHHLQLRL